MLAIIKVGDSAANDNLLRAIRSGASLSQLASQVEKERRASIAIQQDYDQLDFTIDRPQETAIADADPRTIHIEHEPFRVRR